MFEPKSFIKSNEVNPDYQTKTNFQTVFIDTSIKPLDAFFNLFSRKSYNIIRFYSKEFERALEALLIKEKFDIIHLETLWVTPYVEAIRKKTKAIHNLVEKVAVGSPFASKIFNKLNVLLINNSSQ